MLGKAEDPRGLAGRARTARRSFLARCLTPSLAPCLAAAGAATPRVVLAGPPRDTMVDVGPIEAAARRAGLVVHAGERLVLVTDRPPREGDGVPGLPGVFDEAFAAWCAHYGLADATAHGWRACGMLMSDRDRFRAAGLLPDDGSIPDFANGFCDRNRFWLDDQSNPAYRRHLLLHEGVHAFTFTLRRLAAPSWYTEGIAELLATHRLDEGRFVATPIPKRAGDVEQLGRIEVIRRLRAGAACPGLPEVFATPPSPRHDIPAYAASWAAVALLSLHPAHAAAFRALEAGPLDARLDERLAALAGWDAPRAERDFDAFTDEIDYGFDFARSAIDWSAGQPLAGRVRVAVAADRGWQSTGVACRRGEAVEFAAVGRAGVGRAGDTALESTAEGISLRWYRGRPVGRLLLAQWGAPAGGGRPRFGVLGEGSRGIVVAADDGVLHAKLNAPPGSLPEHAGALELHLRPAVAGAR